MQDRVGNPQTNKFCLTFFSATYENPFPVLARVEAKKKRLMGIRLFDCGSF